MRRNNRVEDVINLDDFDFGMPSQQMPPTRNQTRHSRPRQQPQQRVQGHWDPVQGQQRQQQRVWVNGWRVVTTRPRQIDPNCWEVSRELNRQFTQYIQLDFAKAEVRVFVHNLMTYKSVPGTFNRLSLGSAEVLRQMAHQDPERLQEIVLDRFEGYFTAR